MEAKIDKLLKQSDEFTRALQKNEVSILDILINEVIRLVSGKLVFNNISFFQLSWYKLREAFSRKAKVVLPEHFRASDVLIFASEPTHLKQLIPVFEHLKKKLNVYFVVTKLSLHNDLKRLTAPVFLLDLSVKPINDTMKERLKLVLPDDHFLTRYRNVAAFLEGRYSQVSRLVTYFEILTTGNSLKAVVIGNDTTSQGKALSLVCHRRNIPTYTVQHGLITGDWVHQIHSVDTFFTFGQKSKDILVENGMEPEDIEVTGAPYLDSFNKDFASKFTLSNSYILILLSGYGHGTSQRHYQDIISLLFQFFVANQELSFVIKPHRKENIGEYKSKVAELNLLNVKVVDQESPSETIFDYIAKATMVITGNSYTALESMLLNKPVISIDLHNEYSHLDFISGGAVLKVNSYEMLTNTFKNLSQLYQSSSQAREKLLADYYYKNDGNASFRISEYISTQVNKYAKQG